LYDHLFNVENPLATEPGGDLKSHLNTNSLERVRAFVEPGMRDAAQGAYYQFERLGYFCLDPVDATPAHLVFNRTVTLRDAWAKITKGRT
jgi:glutaminyl-tRNA synthetase